MPTSCSVIGCKSRVNAGPKKQFFRFPLNRPKVLMHWLMVIDRMDWTPKPSSKICSEHFASEDFLFRPNVNVPRLKPEAVPSIFPDPNKTQEEPTDDEETPPPESLLNGDDENPIQNQENLNENTINAVATKQQEKSTPIISDDIYSKRPRRTSKINVKMKDFILLDDLRKLNKPLSQEAPKTKLVEKSSPAAIIKSSEHTETFKLDVSTKSKSDTSFKSKSEAEVSKVDAAKELLSILEDSDDEVNTSLPIGTKSLTKIAQPSIKIAEIASKVKAPSYPLKSVPPTDAQRAKQQTKVLKTVTLSSGKKISMTKIAQQDGAVLVSQSSKSQILLAASIASTPNQSNNVQSKSVQESSEKMPRPNIADKFPMGIKTKRPSTDFATTYFPIRCGENFFYFSYADLNPVVDLSRHNVLVHEDLQTDSTTPKNKISTKKNLKRKNGSIESRQHSEDLNSAITENINSALTGRCVELGIEESEAYQTEGHDSHTVQGNNTVLFSDSGDFASESSVDYQLASDDIIDENVEVVSSPIKRRKKKFKTVAEIVVRTDNTKPGEVPSVSIDKIVDFKAAKTPGAKHFTRGRANQESAHVVDVNDNLNNVSSTNEIESSEEELARLSGRITETVKKMKLLDKIKGTTSKLTVLITTLPPIKEKEILIVKKKNLDSNIVQSRELQVVISSNKSNDSTLHGNIVVTNPLGYTILPANRSNVYNKSTENDFSSINSDEAGTSSNPDQEHATVLCYQEKSGDMETSDYNSLSFTNHDETSISSENIEFSDALNESIISDETEEKGKKPTEVIKHDHPYISPNVQYLLTTPNVTVNLAELQPKETGSKMKLTENEIMFRNKVGKKVRSLKDTVQKRNDAINKLKEKVKCLEKALKEVKRTKKNPAKSTKKEINSSMKNDIYYEVDQLVDTSDFSNSMDYSLNNIELPHGLDENADDSEDDDGERECSSPITYLCEPAIEVPSKEREIAN